MKVITFNELRRVKDSLPEGSMHRIAEALNLSEDTVRNYFGGSHFDTGAPVGLHIEPGPDGGVVQLDDERIWDMAQSIISELVTSNN